MKQNRPTETGIYWYKNNYDGNIDGTLVGRPYGRRSGPLMVFHLEDDGWSEMEHFEKCEVAEWLGPAHPPKKVKVCNANFAVGGCWDAQAKHKIVMYGDVKEYLIGDDNETENNI